MSSLDLVVIREYKHKGVNVAVKIDRLNGRVSLVDVTNTGMDVLVKPKEWIFADREVQYMNGWRLVLQAMDFAITEAKKELEQVDKEKYDKFLDLMINLSEVKDEDV